MTTRTSPHPAEELLEELREAESDEGDGDHDQPLDPVPEGGGGVKADRYEKDQPVEAER